MTRKQRPRKWASGTLSGRTSTVESAGRRRITASAATISCQTPCCGRLAPRSDIAGQSDKLAVTIRRDAAAAGWETIPEARAAVSSSSARQATMAHRVAGTAVEPRVAKAARMAAPAVSSAAREAIAQQAVAGSKARGSEAMVTILPRFGGRARPGRKRTCHPPGWSYQPGHRLRVGATADEDRVVTVLTVVSVATDPLRNR